MLGFYNYTVILTYLGMLFGFYGIGSAMDGDVSRALLCLMAAGFCDMFDGKVASTMERTTQQKQFGIQIDSLADLICFGVLPGVIRLVAAAVRFLRTDRAYCPDRWLPGHAAGIPVLSCSRAEIPVPAHCPGPGPRS